MLPVEQPKLGLTPRGKVSIIINLKVTLFVKQSRINHCTARMNFGLEVDWILEATIITVLYTAAVWQT